MEVKASDVKALRERTGAGMLDCKNALVEADGDFDQAEKRLKELGLAAAAKRSGKAAKEGRVFSEVRDQNAALLELSCETDFVSRNEEFIETGKKLTSMVLDGNMEEITPELTAVVDDVKSRIKENMFLRRFKTMSVGPNEMAVDYIHGEGNIGVIVKVGTDNAELLSVDAVKQFAFDCALHVAAFSPLFKSRGDVDAAYISEQEAIFKTQAESLGKPEKVVQGIIKGKLNKHLSEVVFLEQPFVRDDKKKVSDVMKGVANEAGGKLEVIDYLYFKVGEDA